MRTDSRFFRLIGMVGLCVASVLVIAYIAPDPVSLTAELAPGKYHLETAAKGKSKKINGPVYFEYSDKHNDSRESRIFKLHFVNPLVLRKGRDLGFLIPISGTDEMIDKGEYSVGEQGAGVMTHLHTVFGYADMGGKTSAL